MITSMQTNTPHLETLEITSSDSIDSSVIWLHGLGADGHDFAPIVEELQLPHTRFILPHAPYMPVTMNNGYVMRAWYDIFGLEKASKQDNEGIRQSQLQIEILISRELERKVRADRIVLAGFSQGGAIAMHTALRFSQRLGGLIALSTYLPLRAQLPEEAHEANRYLAIFMAHGSYDQVITLQDGKDSAMTLEKHGYAVRWHEYPMAHSVCQQELLDIRDFLSNILVNE